jgi:hypothetical protein
MGTSGKQQKRAQAKAQAAQQRAERQRKARRRTLRNYGLAGGIAVVIAGLIVFAFVMERENIDGVESFGGLSRDHVEEPVTYEQTPPVGGPHSATPLTCGIYTDQVPNENAVHSLEHGAVWITHLPDLDDDELQRLHETVLQRGPQDRSHLLLSPYDGQPEPIMVTAWGRQLILDSADDPRLDEFIDTFVRGRQSPEPGSPCVGVGTPDA